ncbi:zinc finger CCHC domain-containing protein 7-like isoform X2 [Conger conger]|uniref:zinc finger CCHC domain-containing protein 7-like isoform X2 n=1 Tax=Conger conger TaxID=82655 RepID=UPI002A59A6C4|nr:zinc finger CCHC domain-containing protein 7-like isoform X2 [Conger conger]
MWRSGIAAAAAAAVLQMKTRHRAGQFLKRTWRLRWATDAPPCDAPTATTTPTRALHARTAEKRGISQGIALFQRSARPACCAGVRGTSVTPAPAHTAQTATCGPRFRGLPGAGLLAQELPPMRAAGHFLDACPDIWRQYHLTTQTGTLVKPDRIEAHRNPAYCCNCARRGHFGFECSQRRMSSGIYPNFPYVSRYDTTQDVCQRDSRVQKKAKELQDAGLLVLTADPQGGAREDEPTRKRKKNKGAGGNEAKGATPSRGKTWPEKRKERRQIKKLRREAMAHRAGETGPARLEEEEDCDFLRGPGRISSGAAAPPVKDKANPGVFGSGKHSDWKNRKCRDRKCKDRKCKDRKCKDRKCKDRNRSKGRMPGALKHEDVYPADENFLPVKLRARHRKW